MTDTTDDGMDFPTLELAEMELADGEWCIVSADPAKPLTEEQAHKVVLGYLTIVLLVSRETGHS
jgi:hypothetical protein